MDRCPMPEARMQDEEVHAADEEWIAEIQMTLGCLHDNEVKTGSICRVPEKIRAAEDKGYNYRPQLVAMGPFHRGTRTDLQIMEETKWRYMHKLLRRPARNELKLKTVERCSKAIKGIGSTIRARYGDKIDMAAEEFAKMMLLDGCFLLEHLLRLIECETDPDPDEKENLRLLIDLTLLDNQIPFVVLTTLSSTLFQLQGDAQRPELDCLRAISRNERLSPEDIAQSLLKCNVASADFSKGVYHLLHLIHLCSPDPYQEDQHRKDPLQLQRCARKLQAFEITIKASHANDCQGNDKPGTVAFGLRKFADKFGFIIEFNATQRELTIPTLHIKEATEVKWRNLIALEQIGMIGVGYKFTSYAYFFKGLVCCVHDIQLLKEKGVIRVHKKVKDEDLLIMFQTITAGAEKMDARYRPVCEGLNKAEVNGVAGRCVLVFRMPWHYWRRLLEWPRLGLIISLLSFINAWVPFV